MKNEITTPTKLTAAIKAELLAGATEKEILAVVGMVSEAFAMVQNFKATTKVCKTCNEIHPLESFTKRKQNKDGLNASCKSCVSTWTKEYKANKAKAKASLELIQNA